MIAQGHAACLPLPDGAAGLVLTSPPYWRQRKYEDGGAILPGQLGAEAHWRDYLASLVSYTAEWVRVLAPTGSLFVVIGDKAATRWASRSAGTHLHRDRAGRDRESRNTTGLPDKSLLGLPWRYAIKVADELGLVLRNEIIWEKPNGMPDSAADRTGRAHEHVFHFTLRPDYYAAPGLDDLRVPHEQPYRKRADIFGGRTATNGVRHTGASTWTGPTNPLGKIPGSVWRIPTYSLTIPAHLGVYHHAAFPPELARRVVLGWCPPGGLVVDPMGGTGTTALAALANNRRAVSVDLSADYCRIAAWRVSDPGEIAAALGHRRSDPRAPVYVEPLWAI